MCQQKLSGAAHLDVDGLPATFVLQHQVVGTSVIFVCLFDDQLSDVIMGGDHGPVGDVMAILGPLTCRNGFTLDWHRQADDSTLPHHVAIFVLRIKLVIRII